MYRVGVQLQTERLQEKDVIAHYILVGEVELVHHDGIDMVIAKKIICKRKNRFNIIHYYLMMDRGLTQRCLVAYVLEEDVECLKQLDANEAGTSALLTHYVQEVGKHVLLQKEAGREKDLASVV